MIPISRPVRRLSWSAAGVEDGERIVPEETPVALVHDASTTAVMMATPADLEDLACGFTVTEGLASSIEEIADVEIVAGELGVEARVWMAAGAATALAARRRLIVGPTGCGLCGLESLSQAAPRPPRVGDSLRLTVSDVRLALDALAPAQALGEATRAVHAAGWWTREKGLVALREDVGRHNALDKLVGALMRSRAPADGVVVLTSRVSVEMVQKAAVLGAEVIVAVSAPTTLAVRVADEAGLTLVAVARRDGFEVFTHSHRLEAGPDERIDRPAGA